jgi:DNA-binding Lrp family transcriptional regulator
MTNAKCAERLKVRETPYRRRPGKPERAGGIGGYQARLNRRNLGLGVIAFGQSNCSEPDQTATAEFQRTSKATFKIFACLDTIGEGVSRYP